MVQTIPSLALFGLLLPVPFLGDRAARLAIVALTGYALLPILRNTYAGIGSVDPALVDVSNALGMTGWQRLMKVELPMAASVILAGLRTATVTCVGVATIAAAIGAGGLGELIFRGVAAWITGWCWQGRFRRRCWRCVRMGCWGWWRSGGGAAVKLAKAPDAGRAVASRRYWTARACYLLAVHCVAAGVRRRGLACGDWGEELY